MTDYVEITSPALTAAINPLGAELSSLRDPAGRELMTDADPAFWTGRAPLLFPIVGAVNDDTIRIDGREYPMAKHGFARRAAFEVIDRRENAATFRLADSAETRAHYPFPFRLDAAFTLDGATLTMAVTIANPGDAPLPASVGFHPAFAWPLPYGGDRADHRIVFDRPEGDLRQLDDAGLFLSQHRANPLDGDTLNLRDDLFDDDALIWAPVASQRVRYSAATGPQLDIAFPDTPYLGIWTKPGARFVCVEPWHGHADPAGYTGDFRAKPGVFEIAPGGEKTVSMSVTLIA